MMPFDKTELSNLRSLIAMAMSEIKSSTNADCRDAWLDIAADLYVKCGRARVAIYEGASTLDAPASLVT